MPRACPLTSYCPAPHPSARCVPGPQVALQRTRPSLSFAQGCPSTEAVRPAQAPCPRPRPDCPARDPARGRHPLQPPTQTVPRPAHGDALWPHLPAFAEPYATLPAPRIGRSLDAPPRLRSATMDQKWWACEAALRAPAHDEKPTRPFALPTPSARQACPPRAVPQAPSAAGSLPRRTTRVPQCRVCTSGTSCRHSLRAGLRVRSPRPLAALQGIPQTARGCPIASNPHPNSHPALPRPPAGECWETCPSQPQRTTAVPRPGPTEMPRSHTRLPAPGRVRSSQRHRAAARAHHPGSTAPRVISTSRPARLQSAHQPTTGKPTGMYGLRRPASSAPVPPSRAAPGCTPTSVHDCARRGACPAATPSEQA